MSEFTISMSVTVNASSYEEASDKANTITDQICFLKDVNFCTWHDVETEDDLEENDSD